MLILSRREAECVCLGDDVVLTIVAVGNDKVRIGVQAPSGVRILRRELDIRELDLGNMPQQPAEPKLVVEPVTISIHANGAAGPKVLLDQTGEPLAGQAATAKAPQPLLGLSMSENPVILSATDILQKPGILPKPGPLNSADMRALGKGGAGPLRAHLQKVASNRRAA